MPRSLSVEEDTRKEERLVWCFFCLSSVWTVCLNGVRKQAYSNGTVSGPSPTRDCPTGLTFWLRYTSVFEVSVKSLVSLGGTLESGPSWSVSVGGHGRSRQKTQTNNPV